MPPRGPRSTVRRYNVRNRGAPSPAQPAPAPAPAPAPLGFPFSAGPESPSGLPGGIPQPPPGTMAGISGAYQQMTQNVPMPGQMFGMPLMDYYRAYRRATNVPRTGMMAGIPRPELAPQSWGEVPTGGGGIFGTPAQNPQGAPWPPQHPADVLGVPQSEFQPLGSLTGGSQLQNAMGGYYLDQLGEWLDPMQQQLQQGLTPQYSPWGGTYQTPPALQGLGTGPTISGPGMNIPLFNEFLSNPLGLIPGMNVGQQPDGAFPPMDMTPLPGTPPGGLPSLPPQPSPMNPQLQPPPPSAGGVPWMGEFPGIGGLPGMANSF